MRYVIIFFVFFGCKNDPKKEIGTGEQSIFKVHLHAIVPKDDVFDIFYLNEKVDGKITFTETKKIRKKIVGSEMVQRITYDLTDSIYPHQFRIDLGENTNQKEIMIKSVELAYKGKTILIEYDVLKIFFIINNFIDLNDDGTIKFKKVANRRDPFIIAKPILLKKMELEF